MKVTSSLSLTVAFKVSLTTSKSALLMFVVLLALVSFVSLDPATTTFVTLPMPAAINVMLKLADSPTFNMPFSLYESPSLVHVPTFEAYELYVNPSYSDSLTYTSFKSISPLFLTMIVNVTLSPFMTSVSIVIF